MEFSLVEVDEQDYVLVQNMIRFYIYDMSEFTGWGCPSNGLYGGVDDLPYYFGKIPEDPNDRWPEGWTGKGFKIVAEDEIAGFCLVRFYTDGTTQINDIGEFFIVRKWRGKGLGKQAGHAIFNKFPGKWQVRQMLDNRPAQSFWRKVIADFAEDGFSERTEFVPEYECKLVVQRFESSP
jgi:predicted acetyltransferase